MNPNSRILKLRSAVVLAFLLLLAACRNAQPEVATTSSPTATAIQVQTPTAVIHASPGAAGLGDPIYPELGNGGYDVEHYTIELDVDVEANQISGSTIVEAVATQDLSSFDLDFSGLDISLVEVSGREAEFRRDGSELIIELPEQLAAGTQFSTAIQYAGTPKPLEDISAPLLLGWQTQPEGLFVASEPAGAMNWYPNNNHPLDKATYTYRLTVPKPYMVAANGLLEETVDNGETTTYVWQMDDPMASYLATVHIGRYEVETSQGPNGIPIRNYFPITIPQETRLAFEPTAEMMAFMEELIAPYPFDVYGVVLLSEPVGWALETQTLATFGASRPPEFVVFHELAHEWFGNSVSPASWQDTWLNEGFAAYLSRLWEEQQQGSEFFAEQMADNYELLRDNQVSPPIPESPRGLFSRGVYERGAWTLHALRLAVGDELFFEILRTYYDRYQYSTASTADFLAVVTELAGPEAADLVTTWLTEPVIPPLQ